MLIYLIKYFQVQTPAPRLNFNAFFRKFYIFSKKKNALPQSTHEVIPILQFCLDALSNTEDGAFDVYDLMLTRLAMLSTANKDEKDAALLRHKSAWIQRLALDIFDAKYAECIPSSVLPSHLLPFLRQLSADLLQFTALLVWCLGNGIQPQTLIESGVLHFLLAEAPQNEAHVIFAKLSVIHHLLSSYKENAQVSQFLVLTQKLPCGIDKFASYNIWGQKTSVLFLPEQIAEVQEYRTNFALKKFMGGVFSIPLLYRVFKLPFALFLYDHLDGEVSAADKLNIHQLIEQLNLNDFAPFLEYMKTKKPLSNRKLSTVLQLKCISRFHVFIDTFEGRITAVVKENFNAKMCLELLDRWRLLLSITKRLEFIKPSSVWKYESEWQVFAKILQECIVDCMSNHKDFLLDEYVNVLMPLSASNIECAQFLSHVVLVTDCEPLQRKIVASCQFTIKTAYSPHETLFVKALECSNHTLAKQLLHASNAEEVKYLFIGRNNPANSFFYRTAYTPGLFSNLLKIFPESERAAYLSQGDITGDTALHWLADDEEAIALLFPLIPKPIWKNLLQSTNHFKETFLHLGADNITLLRLCDEHIAIQDLLKEDSKQETVIHRAACSRKSLELLLPKIKDEQLLQDQLHKGNMFGQNVIMLAVSNVTALQYLSQYYTKESLLAMEDKENNSLLQLAAQYADSFKFLYEFLDISIHPEHLLHSNIRKKTVLQAAECNEDLEELCLAKIVSLRPKPRPSIVNGLSLSAVKRAVPELETHRPAHPS